MKIREFTHSVIQCDCNLVPDGLDVLHASCSLPSSYHHRRLSDGSVVLRHLDEAQVSLVGRASIVEVLREHGTKGKVVFAMYPDLLQAYRFLTRIQVERF